MEEQVGMGAGSFVDYEEQHKEMMAKVDAKRRNEVDLYNVNLATTFEEMVKTNHWKKFELMLMTKLQQEKNALEVAHKPVSEIHPNYGVVTTAGCKNSNELGFKCLHHQERIDMINDILMDVYGTISGKNAALARIESRKKGKEEDV